MASSEPVSSPTEIICVTMAGNTLTPSSGLVIDCPSLTLCCTSIMAFSMTALPAAWPVISMACRMGTPEVMSVPSVREKRATASLRTISPMPIGMCSLKRSQTIVPRAVLLSRRMPQMRAMMATSTTSPHQLRKTPERPTMMRVSIGSLALPRSLYMPAKIGMRNSTMPMSTRIANEPIIIGYTIADLTARRMLSSFSSCVARRLSTSSRMPPSSPARTMLMYRRVNTLGCFWSASDRLMPASTSARIALITLANFLLGVCSSRTYRQRSIERPEVTMVANCREKTVRSLALMPPPIWIWPQPFLTSLRSRTGLHRPRPQRGQEGLGPDPDRRRHQGQGPHRLLAAVRHHGQLRPLDAALPVRPRGADSQQEVRQGHQRDPRRRRGRHRPLRRARQAPQGVHSPCLLYTSPSPRD